jgi:2'-5' RNA ligase
LPTRSDDVSLTVLLLRERALVLLVIAEPAFAARDRAWIEAIRSKHDPHHRVVPPHFTLVFHAATRAEAKVAAHIRRISACVPRFTCRLRSALIYPDAPSGTTYVSLMPDEGFGAIVRLHDRLYTGPLARHLRLDIPFTPHVTVARFKSARRAQRLADELNARAFAVAAPIRTLDLVRYNGAAIETVCTVPLRPLRDVSRSGQRPCRAV